MNTTTIDLGADAVVEAHRLTAARAFTSPAPGQSSAIDEGSGPWILRSRGRRRRRLAGRMLLIWRIVLEDGCGRRSPAMIVAFDVRVDARMHGGPPGSWMRELVQAIESRVPAPIDRVLQDRERAIAEGCRAFADARLEREQAIAADQRDAGRPAVFQAGLFDRRSDRAHHVRMVHANESAQRSGARIAAAASAAAMTACGRELLLVLIP